jgi:(p)ppGpp synthase/HD superfamily hydrolase
MAPLTARFGEALVVAANLHRDQLRKGGSIGRLFGERVMSVVAACSDTFETPKPPWLERKQAYIEHLSSGQVDRSVLLVSAADKLHNLATTIDDLETVGPAIWDRFHSTAEQQLWYYRALADVYRTRLGGRLADAVTDQVGRFESAIAGSQPPR